MVSDNNTALCPMSMRRWDSLQPLCLAQSIVGIGNQAGAGMKLA